jgi:hypothetical protein
MKGLIIVVITAIALLAAEAAVMRSNSVLTIGGTETKNSSTWQEMQSARSVDKLPVEDFEDRSLVFPRESKR